MSYAMLVSPDRSTLAVIGVGTLFGMPLAATWLHTPSADGQHNWMTTNNPSGYERDPMKLWTMRIIAAKDFAALWNSHQSWVVDQLNSLPACFPAGSEIETFAQQRRAHFELMAQRGIIRFIDQTNSVWRYTFRGALNVTLGGFLSQGRALIRPRR
jgi:hypothetical protein